MTILFIHGISAIGGAERELLVFLERLPRLGHRAILVCPGTGELLKEVRSRGIEARSVPFVSWRKVFDYPRRFSAIRRLRELIECVRPSLIHVNDIWWVPQTLRAAEGTGIPVVGHVRQEIEPAKVKQYGLERLDKVLAVSHQIRRSLQEGGVSSDRAQTLYSGLDLAVVSHHESGVDVRARLGIPPDAILLGTVANLFPRKGYERMLQALPAILAVVPNVSYLIVGSGEREYEEHLRASVRSLGIDSQVHFVGFQKSIYPFLDAMDLYVHPAMMEGFGIAVIEAMAMGKAVVATAVGGLPEIVVPGETGLLVRPFDHDGWVRAITQLLQNTDQRAAFGLAGRKRVAGQFTVEEMMTQLMSVYCQLLGRPSPREETV